MFVSVNSRGQTDYGGDDPIHDTNDGSRMKGRVNHFVANNPVIHIDEKAQSMLDYIAEFLDIRYDVLSNEGGRYHVDLTLTNTGTRPIDSCCFAIYFAHMK